MVDTPVIWKPQEQVNLTDLGTQSDPAVISIGMGRYLVAWTEAAGGPIAPSAGSDIVGQIVDALGNPIGAEFQLNQSFTVDNEGDVALAGRPGGGFVMVYEDEDGGGSIRAHRRICCAASATTPPATRSVRSSSPAASARKPTP